MQNWILGVVIFLIFGIIGLLFWLGAFDSIKPELKKIGPFEVVYLDIKGDYRQVGGIVEKIKSSLEKSSITKTRYYAIYYDDPTVKEKSLLRGEAGHILENVSIEVKDTLSKEFKIKTIPERTYLVVDFPLKNSLSIFLGILKVYPKLIDEAESLGKRKKGDQPSLEIYDISNKNTTYCLFID
jgi:DNA gyrase inhibitor GyrI